MTLPVCSTNTASSCFAMPSNNHRYGHVGLSVRESNTHDDNDKAKSKDQPSVPHQQVEHRHGTVPDTVDFGTTSSHRQTTQDDHMDAHSMARIAPCDIMTSSSSMHNMLMIDNRQLPYIPIRLNCGVCVYCRPEVLSSCPMVLQSLQADIIKALRVLPASVHHLVRRTNVWVNASYSYGLQSDPQVLRHLTTHHEQAWLVECARDIPQKAGGIEVYSCFDFETMRLHWNGSGLLLHELCHLIHQHCCPDGLDNASVQELYQIAKSSKRYENVLRRDWAGMEEDYDLAYAMVDKKEFFAEISVAFLCHGYTHLNKQDCNIMEECCPPLLHPVVTERVLKLHGVKENPFEHDDRQNNDMTSCFWSFLRGTRRPLPKVRIADPIFAEAAISRCCINVDHCNKFYPFTRGQLQHYDPELYRGIGNVWREISMWDDPLCPRNRMCCGLE
jgi:hypothetical protein